MTWTAAMALSALAWCTAAEAALIAEFTGTLTRVSGDLSNGFDIGESVVGSYRFDETTPDSNGDTNFGSYAAIDDYQVEFSGGYAVSATEAEIIIQLLPSFVHRYRALATTSISGPSVSGLEPTEISMLLDDSSETVFSSDALPTSLDLDDFDSGILSLTFESERLLVELTTFSIVPEPATFALLAVGLACALRRRSAC